MILGQRHSFIGWPIFMETQTILKKPSPVHAQQSKSIVAYPKKVNRF